MLQAEWWRRRLAHGDVVEAGRDRHGRVVKAGRGLHFSVIVRECELSRHPDSHLSVIVRECNCSV